jgi:hypothetical protein
MKVKFSPRGANYTAAVYVSREDRQKDVEWIVRLFSPLQPAWVRVVDLGVGRWSKIVILPRSDRLHIDD